MSRKVLQEIEDSTRSLLADRLAQCTQNQQNRFSRMLEGEVPEDQLVSAIDLIDRTIAKNESI